MTEAHIPKYQDLFWPTLNALNVRGGSASIQELVEQMATDLVLPDEVLNAPHGDGPRSEFEYRAAWSRTYLKIADLIDNTSRGIWTVTERGRAIRNEEEVRKLVRQKAADLYRSRGAQGVTDTDGDTPVEMDRQDWKENLLGIVRSIDPSAFERLCGRMLRESGFTKVEVTGRSGDGGIDGTGVLRLNLISFHIRFQCKRFSGSVGAREIRDFRGSMVGRADKGLFITTGRFTNDAAREAVRDGAPPIDLIDGIELCELMKKLGLGVTTIDIPDKEFFRQFEE